MSNIQVIEFINVPVDELVSGEITWKDYINSLSPEDLQKQRQYDRARVKKWYQENKERKQAYHKEYYQKKKEARQEATSSSTPAYTEAQTQTREQRRKEYRRQYYEKHKDHLKELKQASYEKNYERLYTSHTCDVCGGSYSLHNKPRHERSKQHQNALTQPLAQNDDNPAHD